MEQLDNKIIQEAKNLFLENVKKLGKDPYVLLPHIQELEKWAEKILKEHPEADKEIIYLAIYLHDIGHYPINREIDHAITSEKIAKEFLIERKVNKEKISRILHAIRAHRCKDVLPETLEAKIIAGIDSASHMTDIIYIDMAKEGRVDDALSKLERDYRDTKILFGEKLKKLYESWKNLLKSYQEVF